MGAGILDGDWLIPPRGITLKLTQNGPDVSGRLEDNDFKCAVTGRFDGTKLEIDWKSEFSWTNRVDNGSGELYLSGDYNVLSGDFMLLGAQGHWTFARAHPLPAPHPAAQPAHAPLVHHPVPVFPRPYEPFQDWRSKAAKKDWDYKWDQGAQHNKENPKPPGSNPRDNS